MVKSPDRLQSPLPEVWCTMNLSSWDQELTQIETYLRQMASHIPEAHRGPARELGEAVDKLKQQESKYFHQIADLKLALKETKRNDAYSHAVRYWTSEALKKNQDFVMKFTNLLTQVIWLRLIRCRLLGVDTPKRQLAREELYTLSHHLSHLLDSKKYLMDQEHRVMAQRRLLRRHYDWVETLKNNQKAARTLSFRLGETFQKAKDSPALVAMTKLLGR